MPEAAAEVYASAQADLAHADEGTDRLIGWLREGP
jgi:hypothetical protein